jgi:hypothetical protein
MSVGPMRVLALLMLAASPAAVAQTSGPSARDFSGVYFPAPGTGRQRLPTPLPFTPAAKALADAYAEQFRTADDRGLYCIWPGMPRAPWGAPFAIEVFHRPQDLTIFWEGYGMYRKVFMADHDPPEAILPSAMGHSIARWEDDVLVIETTHLKPYPYMSAFPTTSHAHLVERMWLEERVEEGQTRKYLVDELVITDPKLYTEPIRTRAEAVYRPDLTILEYTCTGSLWEAYLEERGLVLPDVDALPDPGD